MRAPLAAVPIERRDTMNAAFTYELRGPVVVLVEQPDGGPSVTNDAEGVIAELVADGLDLAGRRVIYRDQTGLWDELRVKDNAFAGFRILNAGDIDEAIRRLHWREWPGVVPPPPPGF